MVHGQVVRGPVVNYVLLPGVIPTVCQPAIRLVSRIRIEIVHLVVDPGCHRVVKWLVVDVILVIAARVEVILSARPVVLVLVRALINTNYGRVIRFSRPFRRLENGQIRCQARGRAFAPDFAIVSQRYPKVRATPSRPRSDQTLRSTQSSLLTTNRSKIQNIVITL
jgi:hypothetical protein